MPSIVVAFPRHFLVTGLAIGILALPISSFAMEKVETVLYDFSKEAGYWPMAGLLEDKSGNLYGTTWTGGAQNGGTIFERTPDGTETTLHDFTSRANAPLAGLTADDAGNLYGTTWDGGDSKGAVFKLALDGRFAVLHRFEGGSDGENPIGGVIIDGHGVIFGTTEYGGSFGCGGGGCGTVFKLAASGKETVLHVFEGGSDGSLPFAGLVRDKNGNLYGTTVSGGGHTAYVCSNGCGTVLKVAKDGTETILHAFTDGRDGGVPQAGLIVDSVGNLYGTTAGGGANGVGTVFKIAADGTETVLYSFQFNGADGYTPVAGLIEDANGDLFGTTAAGGNGCADGGFGTVFKLAPDGTERVLYSFMGGDDGQEPVAALIVDKTGYLYGTTELGGGNVCSSGTDNSCGTVFKVRK